MGRHRVTLIPGDGIGPEVAAAAARVLSATGIAFEWETETAGAAAIAEHGTPLPPRVLDSIRRNKVALKGPTETPVGTGHRSVNVALRKELDLYANLRPVKSLPGVRSDDARSPGGGRRRPPGARGGQGRSRGRPDSHPRSGRDRRDNRDRGGDRGPGLASRAYLLLPPKRA